MAAAIMFVTENASLYVGDLDISVEETQLYDLFNRVAPVAPVRICRDKARQTSLGYAYVNFTSPHDAAIARDQLNFTPLNRQPMRIMFSHRDPTIRKSGFANIFIKNLDSSIDNKDLLETFSVFGNILSCKVATDGHGRSKGHGYVQFDHPDSAQLAIAKLNGMLLNHKKVYVGIFIRRRDRNSGQGTSKFTNIYVKNFTDSTTEEDLKSLFSKFGAISSVVVMMDSHGRSRLFGFVNFESPDSAAAAVEGMNGKVIIDDKSLYVARAQRKAEREAELREKFEQERNSRFEKLKGLNLYLKNLEENITEDNLKELFAEFGTITSCKIMLNPQGTSNGSGFVAFSTREEAANALSSMHGKLVGRKCLYVAIAQTKEERRAQVPAQFFAQMRPPLLMAGYHHPRASSFSPQPLYYGEGMAMMPYQHAAHGYQYHQQQQVQPQPPPFMPLPMRPIPNIVLPPHYQPPCGPYSRYNGPRRGGSYQPMYPRQWMLRNNNNQRTRQSGNGQNETIVCEAAAVPVVIPSNNGQASPPDN